MRSLARFSRISQAPPSGRLAHQRSAYSLSKRRARLVQHVNARSSSFACGAVVPEVGSKVGTTRSSSSGDTATLTFQDAISKLQEYWASVGCALWLPHNTEVGAGTMNPATFLRVLGPEPWNVAYAEPSIRPDDSRYGDNPNRVQRHTQFQVILKPDPVRSDGFARFSLSWLNPAGRSFHCRPLTIACSVHFTHRETRKSSILNPWKPSELTPRYVEALWQ